MTTDLVYTAEGGIGTITLNRPGLRNALTRAMYEGVAQICREAPGRDGLHALVIQGAGDEAFAAGTDMAEFAGFATPEDAIGYERQMEAVFRAIEDCAVPTIAALTGACTGGGAAISAACDIRVADASLKWGVPIARTLGNCLSIANLGRIAGLIGQGRATEILLTARLIGAEEARTIGLVADVLPDAAATRARAQALARQIAGHAPLTLAATREGLRRLRRQGLGADGSDLVVQCYLSEDFREGMAAFKAKRKPVWQGR